MSYPTNAFKAPAGSTLKVARLDSGIKTCRSHTSVYARVQAPATGLPGPAPPLTETGSHRAPDKLESPECCSHFDRHLSGRVA